jgi:cobalt-zinc-cadmium efflux system outer membrane protein
VNRSLTAPFPRLSDARRHLGLPALVLAVLTGVWSSVGYAANPDDPPTTRTLQALRQTPDLSATSATPFTLTLDQAMGRTLDKHPDLKVFGYTEKTLQAEADIASQRPPINAGLRMQNALGTHETTGFKNAEIALTLASVLERGGKREARQALAAGQLDALGAARETTRLDLLAEVARRYLDVVAAQAQTTIAAIDVAQRERTVAAATKRVQAGASPESARLTAEALRVRAEIDRARANREVEAAYRRLAILWNDRDPTTTRVAGDILLLPEVPDFGVLAALVERSPDLKRFADETRIREARVQLARSARAPDLNWEVGIQRLQDFGSSWGFIAGVTVPLGASHRAEPEIRASENERQALALERESSEFTLYATLAQAYGQYVTGKAEAEACRDDLLPRLARAEAAAERAYRAGALSYLEWAQVQSETMAVHKQQLAAAIEAQRALIEIQRLTGDPFINATAPKDPAP